VFKDGHTLCSLLRFSFHDAWREIDLVHRIPDLFYSAVLRAYRNTIRQLWRTDGREDRRRIRRNGKLVQSAGLYLSLRDERESPKEPARSRRGVEKIDSYGNANVETNIDLIWERKRKTEREIDATVSDVPMSYRDEQEEPQPQRGTLIPNIWESSPSIEPSISLLVLPNPTGTRIYRDTHHDVRSRYSETVLLCGHFK